MPRYRAGLAGCGRVSAHHGRALLQARDVELVALCDPDEERLRAAGEVFGVARRYRDYREMLRQERLDLLTIATQAPQHAPIAIEAAGAGVRGILCEKPIAMTLEEADRMTEACRSAGARLAINHQSRMIPASFEAERLVSDGAIGDLRAAHMIDKGGRPAGNSLMELVTHLFDLLRLYAGTPSWASGHLTEGERDGPQRLATVHDIRRSQEAWPADRDCGLVLGSRCSATFGFPARTGWHTGLAAALDSFFQHRTAASVGRWRPSITLIGTEGVLILSGTSDRIELFLQRGAWTPPDRLERVQERSEGREQPAGSAPHHTAMVEELVAAMEEGREHRSSGEDGRWALEMIMGVYESHRRGGARVNLPLAHRQHPLDRWLQEEEEAR